MECKSFTGKPGRNGTSNAVREPEELLAAFTNTPTIGFAIFDHQLRYQAVNEALAEINGMPAEFHLGKTVRQIFGDSVADTLEPVFERTMATGQSSKVELSAKLPTRSEIGHWIDHCVPLRDGSGKISQVGAIIVEITHQKKLEAAVSNVTDQFMRAREEERRRIARELHDSVNQYHAALRMNLGRLNRRPEPQQRNRLLNECVDLVELCISETRTLCYLLHPPSIDNCSFTSVLQSYVNGFCHRSDIRVHLQLPAQMPPLPKKVELSLFRTVQEALANIYRHAHTDGVEIALKRGSGYVQLSVRDFGRGIPPERLEFLQQPGVQVGVGIASMQERVHELGGMFEIRAASPGTVVNVWLPIEEMR